MSVDTKKSLVEPRSSKRRKPSRKELERAIDSFLRTQHCTLYGRAYDVGRGGSRPEAVEFFANFFEAIDARVR